MRESIYGQPMFGASGVRQHQNIRPMIGRQEQEAFDRRVSERAGEREQTYYSDMENLRKELYAELATLDGRNDLVSQTKVKEILRTLQGLENQKTRGPILAAYRHRKPPISSRADTRLTVFDRDPRDTRRTVFDR
jgi:hypothetical protein